MKRYGFFLFVTALALSLPYAGWSQNKVYNNVSSETVEKILTGLAIKFQKTEHKKTTSTAQYDFKRGEQAFRLYNYGGNDLWIECHFDKTLKLEDVNRWNAEAKFSRAVFVEQKEKSMISLEGQLDCLGGVSDAIVKQFVNRFEDEAKKFVKQFPK
jgi:hypothetical protein